MESVAPVASVDPEKKKKKKKKATAKVDGEPSDPARKSQRKKKSKKKVAAAGSVDVAPAVDGVPVRKKKTLRRKKKKESLFQRPNVLDPFSQGNLHLVRELLRAGEENVVKSNEALLQWRPTLTHRCLEMIVKEPEEAKYRFLYVLLVLDKKTPEEVIGFFEQALHCDETYSPARDSFAYFLECNGHKERASQIYESSFESLYSRQASAADVNFLTLYGIFASENNLEEANVKLAGVWKDCALLCPLLDMTQGNYGVNLYERGERDAALLRIKEAAAKGDAHWQNVLAKLFPN